MGGYTKDPLDFSYGLRRGINLSHWLSQSKRRGFEREQYLTESDIEWIRQAGFDHVRLPIDEEQLWLLNGVKNDTAFGLLHKGINWALNRNLKVVVDLHIIRSHYFNATDNKLWTSAIEKEKLVKLWLELSAELKAYPNSMVAYELMNEPVAPDAEKWNQLIARLHSALRTAEPERWLVIGSNRWQSPDTFDELTIPAGDRRIMLSFHFYEPMFLTHYQAQWAPTKHFRGRVRYPGFTIQLNDTLNMPEPTFGYIKSNYKLWDAKALDQFIGKALQKSRELDLPLYCGEWGCYEKAPMPDKLRWYQDMRRIFELHRIPWTLWDYKGSFGVRRQDGATNTEIMTVLLDMPYKR